MLTIALLAAPSPTKGEGVSVSGEVVVGFGVVTTETPDSSSLDGFGEGTFNLSGEKGSFSGQIEITVVDSTEELDVAEHELVWSPIERLSVTISGHNFGIEPSGGNISVVNAPGGPVGDDEAFVDFADTGMLNVEYAMGNYRFGAALLDACVPDCGYTVQAADSVTGAEEESVLADSELQTVVFHGRREAEGLSFNLYFANSSGSFSGSQTEGTGGAAGAGLAYSDGDLTAGMDFSSATTECAANASEGSCSEDIETTQWGVAVTFAGLGAHYYFGEEKSGAETSETTNIDVVYLFELSGGTVGPEYRTTKTGASGASDTTDSFLLFGMSMEF